LIVRNKTKVRRTPLKSPISRHLKDIFEVSWYQVKKNSELRRMLFFSMSMLFLTSQPLLAEQRLGQPQSLWEGLRSRNQWRWWCWCWWCCWGTFLFILHFSDPEDKGGEAAFSKAPLFFVETAFEHIANGLGHLILGVIWRCCFRQLLRCGKLCQMLHLYFQSVVQNAN